jgi:hypothetical protein
MREEIVPAMREELGAVQAVQRELAGLVRGLGAGVGAVGSAGGLGGLGGLGVGASAAGEVSRLAVGGVWQTTTERSAPLDAYS